MPRETNPAPGRRARRGTPHAERNAVTRSALFDAAIKVVGEHGYAGASVARITQEARVAQGTFYNHFDNRQALLDQLLPVVGEQMLTFIKQRIRGVPDLVEREEVQFRAFFEFLQLSPYFFRILREAELFAPKARAQHMHNIESGYVRSLKTMRRAGVIQPYDDQSLGVIAQMLMAVRDYLGIRHAFVDGKAEPIEEWEVQLYMAILKQGLFAPGPAKAAFAPA
jgi:AcrR family transcriptional regulator